MCKSLKNLKLFDPFSIEFLIGNINRKIAAIIYNLLKLFMKY